MKLGTDPKELIFRDRLIIALFIIINLLSVGVIIYAKRLLFP